MEVCMYCLYFIQTAEIGPTFAMEWRWLPLEAIRYKFIKIDVVPYIKKVKQDIVSKKLFSLIFTPFLGSFAKN